MERDARRMRQGQPFVLPLRKRKFDSVIGWIEKYALLKHMPEPKIWCVKT